MAALEKKRFDVYDYLTRQEINQDLDKVYRIFPRSVADKIKEKIEK